MGAVLIGMGKSLPKLEVKNAELEKLVDTNDEWISSRTGICSRHIAVTETGTDLAEQASLSALGTQVPPDSIDLVIFATITPDTVVPSAACALRKKLGLTNAIAFDINAACSGFIYALSIAEAMMASSHLVASEASQRDQINRALIVCSERLTRLVDWQDRNTCVLFGDGAGACVLEWEEGRTGLLATYLMNEDDETSALTCMNAFDALMPFDDSGIIFDEAAKIAHDAAHPDPKIIDYSYIAGLDISTDPGMLIIDEEYGRPTERGEGEPRQVIRMDGQRIFKFASKVMSHAVEVVLERAGVHIDDVALIIPHQANERIIRFAAKRLDLPIERFQLSMADTGNTSSASVPMALYDALQSNRIKPGDKIIVVAFGGGLTAGAALFEV